MSCYIFNSKFSSVQLSSQSCPTLCDHMNGSMPGLPVHHQLPEFTQNARLSSQWCHPAISSSVVLFSSCPQSLPASESFPMRQLCMRWPSTGVSALASFLPTNTQILVTHKFLHFYSILTMIKYHRSVKTLSYDLSSMGYCFEKFSHLLVLLIVQELNYTQIFLPSSHHLLILLSI